jgi:hypothetical protein
MQFFETFGLPDKPVKYLEANGLPIIYEDAAKTMVMEMSLVGTRGSSSLLADRLLERFIPSYVRELGPVGFEQSALHFRSHQGLGLQNLVLYAR